MRPGRLAALDDAACEEYWAVLALRHCSGLGARSLAKLLKAFGSARLACNEPERWERLGLARSSIECFIRENWQAAAKREWESARKSEAQIILWGMDIYPERLRELPDAPALLYCRGEPGLMATPCVALVGSRSPTAESIKITASLARSLSESGITVVSGMAMGIDREAHAYALQGPGKSIGVLGAGIDVDYPKSNSDIYARMRRDGLLVSEFQPDAPPAGSNFPIRNRIISGLSLGVVVVEAAVRSGSLITARLALEQNREVFAVPAAPLSVNSVGCQNLLRQGAIPVFNVDDILRGLAGNLRAYNIAAAGCQSHTGSRTMPQRPDKIAAPEANVSREAAQKLLTRSDPANVSATGSDVNAARAVAQKLLTGSDVDKALSVLASGPLHRDQILDLTGIEPGELSQTLLALELEGRIELLSDSRYEIANFNPQSPPSAD